MERAGGEAGARLDRPAPAGARVRFPDSFGRRFAIFADAEEEFDWSQPFSREAVATTAVAALPEGTRRLNAAGVVPTYLADYPIANDPRSAAIVAELAAAGACDVGVQLHPWVTPPFDEVVSARNSFAGNLPPALEAAKLRATTERVAEATGVRPIVYRAGRYGVGPSSVAAIRAAGHRLDVSVRPLFDYSAEGGPDFRAATPDPWWAAEDLLEAPLGVTLVGALRRWGRLPHSAAARALLARTGLLARVALTPEGTPIAAACAAVQAMLADGARFLSFSFHTPSLAPGHTPYVRDAAGLARFWRWWDAMFDLLAREGVTAVRPDELIAAAEAGRDLSAGGTPR
ncbi:hypothetical protein SAMN05192580_0137 [Sphingomonas jatrophae]|uniref:WalW protein n=2 Tax=Sphingomonas jatrophae TaxID=1166337 RepID=A0A1I6JDG2_9SPHN|nr:hypothetical protein SAMN05192580_0137 [Sphingomonas jatrophae]